MADQNIVIQPDTMDMQKEKININHKNINQIYIEYDNVYNKVGELKELINEQLVTTNQVKYNQLQNDLETMSGKTNEEMIKERFASLERINTLSKAFISLLDFIDSSVHNFEQKELDISNKIDSTKKEDFK